MRLSKKASLQLSINAIVILILAITMLGLGLGFMRNIFGSATEQFTQVTGQVEKQMIEQMKESGKIVDLDRPKITVKRATKDQIYIGLKNVNSNSQDFKINTPEGSVITGLGSTAGTKYCDQTKQGTPAKFPSNTVVRLHYKESKTSVGGGDVVVLPINVEVMPSAQTGTCFFNIPITDGTTTNNVQLTVDVTV